MREALYAAVAMLAAERDDVEVVVADMGSFRAFRDRHPDRFHNVGVSESLSVGVAAGLASEGKKVFLYSVAGFTLYRAFEQIKFAVGYWAQDVTITATGFGWRYFQIGRGHRTPDDVALMRLVPNMRVCAPATEKSLHRLILEGGKGPRFIRLGEGLPEVPVQIPSKGRLATVIALGEAYLRLVRPVQQVRDAGHDVGLIAAEYLDPEWLASVTTVRDRLVVVEDHVASGGLADALRTAGRHVIAHHHLPVDVDQIASSEEDLLRLYGFREQDLTTWLLQYFESLPRSLRSG